jgi:hypothetical protein
MSLFCDFFKELCDLVATFVQINEQKSQISDLSANGTESVIGTLSV